MERAKTVKVGRVLWPPRKGDAEQKPEIQLAVQEEVKLPMHVDVSRAGGVKTLRRKYEQSYPSLPIIFPNEHITAIDEQEENDDSPTGKYVINGGDDDAKAPQVTVNDRTAAEQALVAAAVHSNLQPRPETTKDLQQNNKQRTSVVVNDVASKPQESVGEITNITNEVTGKLVVQEEQVKQLKTEDVTPAVAAAAVTAPDLEPYGTYGDENEAQQSYGTYGEEEEQTSYGTFGDEEDQTSYGTFGDEDQTSYGTYGEEADKMSQLQGTTGSANQDNKVLANRPLPDKPGSSVAKTNSEPDEIYEEIPNQQEYATYPGKQPGDTGNPASQDDEMYETLDEIAENKKKFAAEVSQQKGSENKVELRAKNITADSRKKAVSVMVGNVTAKPGDAKKQANGVQAGRLSLGNFQK